MAYNIDGFSFNPVKPSGFNPTGKNVTSADPVVSRGESLYVPTCNESTLIRDTYRKQVEEVANNFGMPITYLPKKYDFDKANFLYGEDAISGFHHGKIMKAIIDFASYSVNLTKFGFMSTEDMTIYIPITEFEKVWGPQSGEGGIYPLAGDLFYINDSSCDRPLQQSPMVFEVVEKDDKINPVDFMGGHYVWKLTARRFDYSYEPNAPEERFLDTEAGDTKEFGLLPGGSSPPDMSYKEYDVDDFAKTEFEQTQDSVYGKYL